MRVKAGGIVLDLCWTTTQPNMKTLKITAFIAFIALSAPANAQYKTAIGLRAGESSGLTIKHFTNETTAWDFIISFWPNDLSVFALYEKHKPLGSNFNLYYGVGGHLAFNTWGPRRGYYYYDDRGRYRGRGWWYRDRDGFGLGIDGILGLEFKVPDIPLAISLDIKPYIEFNTDRNIYWSPDPGLGLKIAF